MLKKLRLITLQQQGLIKKRSFGTGIAATQRVLGQLGYIQVDTLAVVERAHHHTLWTRIPDYSPDFLNQLVQDRDAFEYWFHAASYLPMRDYRFALPQMMAIKRGDLRMCADVDKSHLRRVYDRIRIDGPLKARDFGTHAKGNAKWWNWKPAKRALERLFLQGDLMITGREGMEKIFDLRERVLPPGTNTQEPTLPEFCEYLIEVSINAHGFTTVKQLTHLRSGEHLRNALTHLIQQKLEQGSLIACSTPGMPTVYTTEAMLQVKNKRPAANVRILSPFDNAIIHRDRVKYLFDFDYRLECYVPKDKRQFGYFCLPILYRDTLVGRMDCKAHRKTGELQLINLHLESKGIDLEHFLPHFAKAAAQFAKFNQCYRLSISNVTPKKHTYTVKKALRSHVTLT